MNIIVLLSLSHFFYFFFLRIITIKSKTVIFSLQMEIVIASLKKSNKRINKLFQDRQQRNFWSVRNVQIISIIPYLSSKKKCYPMLHLKR